MSPWIGTRSSALGDNFWISLTALRLFCYCYFVIRQDQVLHANLISCRVVFMLSCFYKSNFSYLFCKLWLCPVLIAAGEFLTDVDRLPWKSQSELCVVRATHKVKSLGFVWRLSFFSLPAASRLSRVEWFSRPLVFRLLYYPEGKMGTTRSLMQCSSGKLSGRYIHYYSQFLKLSGSAECHLWS